MFTPEAINALQKTELLRQLQLEIGEIPGLYAIPPGFVLSDQEHTLLSKRREANNLKSTTLTSWAEYINDAQKDEIDHLACIFVNPKTMCANAVLNWRVGKGQEPGHCDNTAQLAIEKTPEHLALQRVTQGPQTQRGLIEWIEDNTACIDLFRSAEGDETEPQPIQTHLAIAALRSITIDQAKRVETQVQALSTTRSALESVTAKSSASAHIPTLMRYYHAPFESLSERTYEARIAVLTGGTAPCFSVTLRNEAQHLKAMAFELQSRINAALHGCVPCFVGEFAVGK